MSDPIKHECGIALIRLLKPLDFYREKYGSCLYGFDKLFLLMEKQHNRGQDGAGVAALKLDMPPGLPYMFREREVKPNSLDRIFRGILKEYDRLVERGIAGPDSTESLKRHFEFAAEIYLGHLRYGTFGGYNTSSCHPYFRRNNWPTKNLLLAGNFNLTNTPELNQMLIETGQHPIFESDTQTLLEKIGFFLDEEHDRLYHEIREEKKEGKEIARAISERLDPREVLRRASRQWDGGYTIAGLIGNGDLFVLRDPNGIRPCHYYRNDEVVAFASERAPLMTVFGVEKEEITEVRPAHAVVVKKNGAFSEEPFTEAGKRASCSFERIYFSRGNDPEIYQERKALGGALTEQILEAIDHDFDRAVFSFIPNTAEVAYFGMMEQLRLHRRQQVKMEILEAARNGGINEELLDRIILNNWPRGEKVAIKDIKLRTFISQEKSRKSLVSHVYDISYGTVRAGEDILVCIDDSIVRGTTLRNSILKILSRLKPKKIVIASTAPQIRYPDCYGIDMSELRKFIAFEAAVALLKEQGKEGVLREVYEQCQAQLKLPVTEQSNVVGRIYEPFTPVEISAKIAQLVTPKLPDWTGEVQILFQGIENLHRSVPNNQGDWYFTGNYPTPGGFQVLNKAFINYFEENDGRSY
jgi:amidophosphoribosyltransferase